MRDLVHKGIVDLIYRVLAKLDPAVVNTRGDILKRLNEPGETISNNDKVTLLQAGYNRFGISIFQELGESLVHYTSSPLLFFLLNSESPSQLLSKLQSYDRYFHSSRQLKLLSTNNNHLVIEHYSTHGNQPYFVEELFVFYVVKALLGAIGCQNLKGNWAEIDEKGQCVNRDCTLINKVEKKRIVFEYEWDTFARPKTMHGLDEFLLSSTTSASTAKTKSSQSTQEKVLNVVNENISHRWTLPDVAEKLWVSPRTLQRRLKSEGISFCQIVLNARIEHAYQLLSDTNYQITEIGLMCGFSDGAHFSREFKRAVGCVPSVYRDT